MNEWAGENKRDSIFVLVVVVLVKTSLIDFSWCENNSSFTVQQQQQQQQQWRSSIENSIYIYI